jgi:hyperosmotically inducible protein
LLQTRQRRAKIVLKEGPITGEWKFLSSLNRFVSGRTNSSGKDFMLLPRKRVRLHLLTLQSDDCTSKDRRREMTKSKGLSRKVIFMTVLMVFGLALFSGCASMTGRTAGEHIDDATITTKANAIIVKDPDAKYLKIDVSSLEGNVALQGFIHDRAAEERIVAKIKQINGVKSVKSNLKVQEKK